MLRFGRAAVVALGASIIATKPAEAQVTDSVRPSASRGARIPADSGPRAPISPRRAFLYSLAVPGSAQTILGRDRTAALFVTVEAVALTMARKSANDLREAKRHARDSLVATYRLDPATGRVVVDSNGFPIPATWVVNDLAFRVPARRTHLEDWIATLAFNHLLSGAEAFVSAHLWELPGQVSMEQRAGGRFLMARIRW